jgi:hypothetical protein
MPSIRGSLSVYKLRWMSKYMGVSLLAKWFGFSLAVLLVSSLLVGCSGLSGGNIPGSGSSTQSVALSDLPWCNNKPDETFMNDATQATNSSSSASTRPANETPVAINWSVLKANLGFTLFLPKTLPDGSCLLKPFGWVHNASSHNSFIITYMLPDRNSLTIAQTLQNGPNTLFQCFVSPDPSSPKANTPTAVPDTKLIPIQLCSGVRDKTNITFSARWTPKQMQQFFNGLQPDVNWMPAG